MCFVLVLGKIKTKLFFLVLQWYFDLSKQKVFVLIFVLTKPKQNRAGQLITIIRTSFNVSVFVTTAAATHLAAKQVHEQKAHLRSISETL